MNVSCVNNLFFKGHMARNQSMLFGASFCMRGFMTLVFNFLCNKKKGDRIKYKV
jgi:hypothetical protein